MLKLMLLCKLLYNLLNGNNMMKEGETHTVQIIGMMMELKPLVLLNLEKITGGYGRDYVWGSGNQNRQWLDIQITI